MLFLLKLKLQLGACFTCFARADRQTDALHPLRRGGAAAFPVRGDHLSPVPDLLHVLHLPQLPH